MSIHNTTAPRAGQPEPEVAEPARRASRFDERGIALQTVIIMVVLLAIAGAVAAVLFSRASESTEQLESTDVTVDYRTIRSKSLCESTAAGNTWSGSNCKASTARLAATVTAKDREACLRLGGTAAGTAPAITGCT